MGNPGQLRAGNPGELIGMANVEAGIIRAREASTPGTLRP